MEGHQIRSSRGQETQLDANLSATAPEFVISVPLAGNESYDVMGGTGWISELGKALARMKYVDRAVMVFTSPRIGGHYFDGLKRSLKAAGFKEIVRHDIPDGEANKNMDQYTKALGAVADNFPDPRHVPLVINLGGGVVSDIGGFVAGSFRRGVGVDYIQVPTSLLGDVDCGVGGKVGVNLLHAKNIVGLIYQPRLVFIDLNFLQTLDKREIQSGTAEIIKYGVVCDGGHFDYLEQHLEKLLDLDPVVTSTIVKKCVKLKADVVCQDPKDDRDHRIVLNFGHTIGHAIEMAADLKMTHGEAISIGMVGATRLAIKLQMCSKDILTRLVTLLNRAGLPKSAKSHGHNLDLDLVLETMKKDKKAVDGNLRFVLPTAIGNWEVRVVKDSKLIRDVVSSCIN